MKKTGKTKKLLSFVLAVVMMLCAAPIGKIDANAASWSSDYRNWSQAASDIGGMRSYGCWVVAQAKMIYEANINRESSFNPDTYYWWQKNNGYIDNNFYQTNGGYAPVAYANQRGKNLEYLGYWTATDNQLWFNINAGYYTIVYVGNHYVLLANDLSKQYGKLYCYDSWNNYTPSSPQPLTRYANHYGGYVYKANNPTDTQSPTVSNIRITNLDSTGYDVTCTVSDNVGVVRVAFPTWTIELNQDDVLWKDGTISGNTATFRVKKSEHGGQSGLYATHIYAYDASGNWAIGKTNIIDVPIEGKVSETTYKTSKYVLYQGKVSATYAKEYCEKLGGHLARITSVEENNAVQNLIGSFGKCWIDGTNQDHEGTWKFFNGQSMTYFNWASNQPDNSGGEQNHLAMYKNGSWDDLGNGTTSNIDGFVCEFDNYIHDHKYTSKITTAATCTNEGVKKLTCSICDDTYTEKIPALGHIDENNDGKCDRCAVKTGTSTTPDTQNENCTHICHSGGLAGFIWKIIRIFCKIFKTNRSCTCGIAHY